MKLFLRALIVALLLAVGGVLAAQTAKHLVRPLAKPLATTKQGASIPDPADADYTAYYGRVLANGSDLNASEKTAAENLIVALKANGLWADISHLFFSIGNDHLAAKTYVKGTQDLVVEGSVNMFDGSRYSRQQGFYRYGGSAYEAVMSFGYSYNWDSATPMTAMYWGRNSGTGARLGIHPSRTGSNNFYAYHNSAYSYGVLIKARRDTPANQETGIFGGGVANEWSSFGVAYDGVRVFTGRLLRQDNVISGATLTLTSDHAPVSGKLFVTADNPMLGICIANNVEWTSGQLDTFNSLIRTFSSDCGVTLTATAP